MSMPNAERSSGETIERWRKTWRLRKLVETSPPNTFAVDWEALTATYIGPGSTAVSENFTPSDLVSKYL